MSNAANKALAWGVFSILLGEGVPILILWLQAMDKNTPFLVYLTNFMGYAGPILIGYGILAAAHIDIFLDELTVLYIIRHSFEIVLILCLTWWAFEVHFFRPVPVTSGTMIVDSIVAIAAFIGAGLAKNDSWRRLTLADQGHG